MARRTRNPHDPDYPHGSLNGYRHGCRSTSPCPATTTCFNTYQVYATERRERIKRGEPRRYRAAPLRAYIQHFLDDDWHKTVVARAIGMSDDGLRKLMNGSQDVVRAATAKKILAVDVDALIACADGRIPARLVRWKLGSLCALGWPCAVQAAELGYSTDTIVDITNGTRETVSRDMADDIDMFFERARRTTCASPQRKQAIRYATRLGYRTPDAYAPDGVLWEEEVRDEKREERWARRDRESLLHMQVARLAVKENRGLHTMAVELGLDNPNGEQAIRRCRANLGLLWNGGKAHGPKPGQEARIAEILAVVEKWRLAGPLADPWPFCVELGMMTGPMWVTLDGKPKLEAA